jgi:hypothetical protein
MSIATLVAVFGYRLFLIFRPSALYEVHSKLTGGIIKFGQKALVVENAVKELPAPMAIEKMTVEQRTKWAANLQLAIILNRGCKYFSRKLENYQRSRLTSIFYALNFLMLVAISILMFSLINYAIYKIDPSTYSLTVRPSFFIFFYYSANTIWGHGITEVAAIANVSRVAFLGELFVTFLLVVIFFTLWTSVKSEREADEIREIISEIRRQGDKMAMFIKSEYGFSVEDALSQLIALKLAGMIKIIEFLSVYEERPSEDG